MNHDHLRIFCGVVILASLTQFAGCASTAPKAEYSHDIATQYRIDADDRPQVNVNAGSGVAITDVEKQRIAQLITSDLEAQRLHNVANNDPKDCLVEVTITRYEKGNAFARAMLAGLGQIHIDANVKILAAPTKEKLAEFTLNKTFAWRHIRRCDLNGGYRANVCERGSNVFDGPARDKGSGGA